MSSHALRDLLRKYLIATHCFILGEVIMFTIESFCNSVWGESHNKVVQSISKGNYGEFELKKKMVNAL